MERKMKGESEWKRCRVIEKEWHAIRRKKEMKGELVGKSENVLEKEKEDGKIYIYI